MLIADFFSRERSFFAFLTGFAGRGAPGILGTSAAFLAASLASCRPFLPLPFPMVEIVEGGRVVVEVVVLKVLSRKIFCRELFTARLGFLAGKAAR